jgi:hypothetical protein
VVERKILADTIKEALEKEIVELIATEKDISRREAMDIFYSSDLSSQIDKGEYGIHYLDAKYLLQDLIENEPELFVS